MGVGPLTVAAPLGSRSRTSADGVEVLDGHDSLAELSGEWDELAETPFQKLAWVRALLTESPGSLRLVVVRSRGRAAAIAPLLLSTLGPRRAQLLGQSEFSPVLGSDPRPLELLAETIAKLRIPMSLPRVPAGTHFARALREACRGHAFVVDKAIAGAPYIALDESWIEPESRLNAGRRSDLRRARRRAEALGEITTEIVTPTAEEVDSLLDECFTVEGVYGNAAGSRRNVDFHRRYARAAAREGILRVCLLRIGGRSAAMQIAVESDGRFWLVRIGYDAEFRRSSPGILLALETIRLAAQQGLATYEIRGEPEPWTRMLTDLQHPTRKLAVYPANPRGIAALAADGVAVLRRAGGALRRAGDGGAARHGAR